MIGMTRLSWAAAPRAGSRVRATPGPWPGNTRRSRSPRFCCTGKVDCGFPRCQHLERSGLHSPGGRSTDARLASGPPAHSRFRNHRELTPHLGRERSGGMARPGRVSAALRHKVAIVPSHREETGIPDVDFDRSTSVFSTTQQGFALQYRIGPEGDQIGAVSRNHMDTLNMTANAAISTPKSPTRASSGRSAGCRVINSFAPEPFGGRSLPNHVLCPGNKRGYRAAAPECSLTAMRSTRREAVITRFSSTAERRNPCRRFGSLRS